MGRKLSLWILGLASLAGIISLIIGLVKIITQLVVSGSIGYGYPIEFIAYAIIPIAYVCVMTYKLWKNEKFYERYKYALNIASWGIVITLLLTFLIFIYALFEIEVLGKDSEGILLPVLSGIIGIFISFAGSIIGLIVDLIRKK